MGALANESAATGAPTWWSNGHLGGDGIADTVRANLAIMDDKIQEDQPLFDGVDFERPGDSIPGTLCGQATAGCEHGTEVAGMAVAVGNSGCSSLCTADTGTERGVAYGVAHVLDADTAAMSDSNACLFNGAIWALGITQAPIGDCEHSLSGALHPSYIHSDSHGSYTSSDDSVSGQNLDKFTSAFGAIQTEPSGNDGLEGTGSGHITNTCVAYDVICVGGVGYIDPTTTSDDAIANFSSQGPSPGGRKKPDLVATAAGSAGGANMTVVEQRYVAQNRLERGDTGTSFASPQVAGAAALLYGAGLTDPLVVKAILLDSTTLGRATPASAMGTQTTWQPDWGWGELNLDQAYQERSNFQADDVAAQGVRFYRADVNAGDRATLVWNRRVVGAADQTAAPQALTLSNLDLYQYAASSQTELASSTSAIDNVEQVRGTGSQTVVYKVKDQSSTVDGLAEEPFALAATNPLTSLAAPKPTVTLTLDRSSARQGDEVTVTETVHNPSADIAGASTSASVALPSGVTVSAGGSTTWAPGGGTLAAGATDSHHWTIEGTADGIGEVTATAQGDAYGETFHSVAASARLDVDSTPPVPVISCSHPAITEPRISVSWSAADASAITGYDVEVSIDGGPPAAWLGGTQQTTESYSGTAGHSYDFRVRATDELGNASGFVTCGGVSVGFAPVPPASPLSAPSKVLPVSPRLKLLHVRTRHGRLVIEGRLAAHATGRVVASYTVRGRRAVRAHAAVHRGRYRLILKLLRGAGKARPGVLRIRYTGDHSFAPQRISRRIR